MSTRFLTSALAFAVRTGMLLILWWVLVEGDAYRLWFGVLVAAVAAAISLPLLPPLSGVVRIIPVATFIPFFLWHSLLGGIDVGRRVIRRRPAIEPRFIRVPLELEPGPARLWLVAVISLMPGTLSCHLRDDDLEIHVLDPAMPSESLIRRLEHQLQHIFV